MVIMAPPLASAIESINARYRTDELPATVLMTPQGSQMTHAAAQHFSGMKSLIIVCGHYEGIDERFIEEYVDWEISIGDFVLTGGEIPAMAMVDSVTRLIPGVLGDIGSAKEESFSNDNRGMLEGPVYTRPAEFRGRTVPEVLLNGNRREVERFRRRKAAERTLARRPDLMKGWGPEPPIED